MKRHLALAAAVACAVAFAGPARASLDSELDCLRSSAVNGGLGACLNESGARAPAAVFAGAAAPRPAEPSPRGAASAEAGGERRSTIVPTPTGFASAEEGSLKAGFYNGLDSGFKTTFMAIEYLPVLGMEASGAPNRTNAGTVACAALGVLLAIPAAIVAAALGAPLGAAAGMIAEKSAPGSTNDWFTF